MLEASKHVKESLDERRWPPLRTGVSGSLRRSSNQDGSSSIRQLSEDVR